MSQARRNSDTIAAVVLMGGLALIFVMAAVWGGSFPPEASTGPILTAVFVSGAAWTLAGILPVGQKIVRAWMERPNDADRPDGFEVAGAVSNGFAAAAATFAGLAALRLG